MPTQNIKIIFEDSDVVALNKPAGMAVHHDAHHTAGTLVDFALSRWPEIRNVGDEAELRPGIVHRLDKDTSGLIIIAKNQTAFEYLKKAFQGRDIKKTYTALVVGNVKNDTGTIDMPIGRSRKEPTKRTAIGDTRGKIREAVTLYKVLKRFRQYTLLEASPLTGRTHQIRVHLKAVGHPVVCDKLYAGKLLICPFGLARHFLHASAIELTLPSGSRVRLEASLTEDLQAVLDRLAKTKNI